MKHFALAGNPNCGKTTLFNSLTGSTAYVGNWPGVTVDKKEGTYKKCPEPISIIDLPGIYSLSPYTPEEIISRNYILDEQPDCIINIIDATNLERNLYLTTQLLEIDVPIVLALNMIDVLKKNNKTIDIEKMSKELGVPVVGISALKEENMDQLMQIAFEESQKKRVGKTIIENADLNHLIKDCKIAFDGIGVKDPLFHAIKLVELDEIETKMHPELVHVVEEFKTTFNDDVFGNDFEALIADSRYKFISKEFGDVKVTLNPENKDTSNKKETKSDRFDKVLTNRWLGIPIFLIILFLIFHLTFSENLFYLGRLFSNVTPSFSESEFFAGAIWSEGGINSIGVILQNLMIGFTDWLSSLASKLIESIPNCPLWIEGFFLDGILAGIFSVLSFLPQILLLFLFFSILEDSGYMARVAFILDRIFRKFGLSGRAFMPMIMGFGCSVPAMINTRTLADENERTATIRVIPFFSCGAKLPILTAIAGGIVELFGIANADLITYSMYLLGMLTAICAVLLMRNTTLKGDIPPFIMELPAYHAPQFKGLMIHLWDKLKHFIKKAFTIILASTIVIWFLQNFTWSWQYIPGIMLQAEEAGIESTVTLSDSILASIGQFLQPLFTPVGFGSQLSSWGWVFVVAAVTGLIAKENVIMTFGVLAACIVPGFTPDEALEGVDSVVQMINNTGIGIPGLLAFIAFNMTTIPCFAAVATAKAELPKKRFVSTLVFWLVLSYVVSIMIYVIGSWWWTSFIFVALIALMIVVIILWNRYKKQEVTQKE